MSDKLKPVRCGCGGEAKVRTTYKSIVVCSNCQILSDDYKTEAEAIEAWNRAMGERTAKVDRDTIFPVTVCGVCHSTVAYPNNYCSNCGAKLDWSE